MRLEIIMAYVSIFSLLDVINSTWLVDYLLYFVRDMSLINGRVFTEVKPANVSHVRRIRN